MGLAHLLVQEIYRVLRELDMRYRFLFADESRIFEARMVGTEEALLLDLGHEERPADVSISSNPQLSPGGRWLLVPYTVPAFDARAGRRLLLLDVSSRETRRVPLPQEEEYGFDVTATTSATGSPLTASPSRCRPTRKTAESRGNSSPTISASSPAPPPTTPCCRARRRPSPAAS